MENKCEPNPQHIDEALPEVRAVDGGHMLYDKCVIDTHDAGPIFIKAHNEGLFTDEEVAARTLLYLRREGAVYRALQDDGYVHLPEKVVYDDASDVLYMSAHLAEHGWHWELPADPQLQERYAYGIIDALRYLDEIPASALPESDQTASLDEIYQEGWEQLQTPDVQAKVLAKLDQFKDDLHPHVLSGAQKIKEMLQGDLKPHLAKVHKHLALPRPVVGHFDARQSNIVWHPDHGAKLVDWSWASAAPKGCDRTMFVIDLFKSGYDVRTMLPCNFNPAHALLLTGHWLVRSTMPTNGDPTVRFHQLASAVSAATLLL